ncbi:MAG: Stp1/IreP family PP2C-type Ser/Thr phosphatase [Solirubrobacteraceae bacterium]
MLRAAETIAKTDTGRQRRENEDSMLARAPLFVVADGMGGAQAGEVASKIAVQAFEQGLPDSGSAEERLAARAREANQRIHELSRAHHERAGMGTTLTAACLDDDRLAIAQVGDSRAYLFRDGSLGRLTQDHSLVGELVRKGELTEEQAAEHPQRSIITRALGPEASVEVDTLSYRLRAGDLLLLCSDGLTSMLAEERISAILADAAGGLEPVAGALIAQANDEGGRDNITVVLVRLEEAGGDPPGEHPTVVGLGRPRREPSSSLGSTRAGSAGGTSPATSTSGGSGPAARGSPALALAPRSRSAAPGAAPAARAAPASERHRPPATPRRPRRHAKLAAGVIATLIVLFVIAAGGWLASRQLYFIGTNAQGIVTIYRGLPYDLPAGVRLYEQFYVSGVPAALVPADRRSHVLDHHLVSQSSASKLVSDLELGKLTK